MDLEGYFSNKLNDKKPKLDLSKKTWDRRADEVNQFIVSADDFALRKVLQHHNLEGAKLLEISFGGGRHLLEFARRGALVSGVEISANMLKHCEKKLMDAGFHQQVDSLLHSSWEELQLAEQGWQEAFDLVFMYMSPAISSTAMLQKALDASCAGLYMSLYAYREDSLLGELRDQLGLKRRSVGSKGADDIYNIFNLLFTWGYFPSLEFEEIIKTSSHAPEYILQRYASWLWADQVDDANLSKLLKILQDRTVDGLVSTHSRDIIGHLYLDKRIRRQV